jgi:hypothetical protein
VARQRRYYGGRFDRDDGPLLGLIFGGIGLALFCLVSGAVASDWGALLFWAGVLGGCGAIGWVQVGNVRAQREGRRDLAGLVKAVQRQGRRS